MLLYGISFFYGLTGQTDFSSIGQALDHADEGARFALMLGLVFLMSGMAFKVSVAPFHMWTPAADEGAPPPLPAFMSTAPKVAAFVLFARLLMDALPSLAHDYGTILTVLAVLSLAVGNLAAIAQRSIKRMLAYSTIGHAGFVLLGLLAGGADGYAAIMLYLSIYIVMNMGAFAIIILMRREGIQGELLEDFAGLAKARPGYGLAMGIFMFSLAGIPFMGGFWAKYAVFAALIDAGHVKLAVIAVLFAAIGAFYYLRVVKYIYFDEQRVAFDFVENRLMQATVAVAAITIVIIGVFPGPLMDICKAALAGIV
jgi:NADH-quinone oxidoreductase subunit N